MQSIDTVAQPTTKNLQVIVTEDAARRIKVEAAKRGISAGKVISELATENLPPVEDIEAA